MLIGKMTPGTGGIGHRNVGQPRAARCNGYSKCTIPDPVGLRVSLSFPAAH
jgi:hypothetical protein